MKMQQQRIVLSWRQSGAGLCVLLSCLFGMDIYISMPNQRLTFSGWGLPIVHFDVFIQAMLVQVVLIGLLSYIPIDCVCRAGVASWDGLGSFVEHYVTWHCMTDMV
jgi:hypothetical protein